jgi:hypothetical protein
MTHTNATSPRSVRNLMILNGSTTSYHAINRERDILLLRSTFLELATNSRVANLAVRGHIGRWKKRRNPKREEHERAVGG